MKYLLFALLCLTGCKVVWNDPPATTPPIVAPGPQASGSYLNVEWNCRETDLNDALVMVQCDFHNTSPPAKELCIKVEYDTVADEKKVTESRDLCSGPLWADGTSQNYAAFFKEARQTLTNACGAKLEKCYMATRVTKP